MNDRVRKMNWNVRLCMGNYKIRIMVGKQQLPGFLEKNTT